MVKVETAASGSCEAERLKTLLALHEAALESMSHGLCMVDADQRLVLYNQRFLELFNLTPEVAHVGAHIRALIGRSAEVGNFPASQADDVYRRRVELMARGKPFELRRQFSHGRTYSLFYRPMADGGWITLVEDVTERQRKEYEMRVQFERFDQAITHMSHGLCMVDAAQRIVLFNQQFLKMYNLPPGLVTVGMSMRDLFAYGARHGYFDADLDTVWRHRLERMAARKPFQQRMRLSGGYRYLLHYHPMDDGGWVTLCEDVTERDRMQHELMLQYARFDQAINHMSHGLCLFGPDERLVVCNARYIEMYGLDPEAVRPGITHREVVEQWIAGGNEPGMSSEEFYASRKSAVATGEVSTMLLHVKDGRVIEATSRPTPDGGWVSAHEEVTERLRYEEALREQNMLFDAALENMAHALCMFDKDWRVIVHNRRFIELYGLEAQVVQPGTPLLDLIHFSLNQGVHTGQTQNAEEFFEEFKRRVMVDRDELVVRRFADGRLIAVRYQPLSNGGRVCTYEDITERERAAEELKEQHHRFDIALNNMTHGLCMFDGDMRLIVCNKRYYEMFGMSPAVIRPGKTVRDVLVHSVALGNYRHLDVTVDGLYEAYVKMLNAGDTVIHRHLANGRMIKITHERMAQGGWVAIYEDVTERHRVEQNIAHMARHDALTDLPNRVLFRERMAEGLSRVEGFGETLAVLCLDLDNFKGVNDTLGHPIGDRLLGTIAERIRCAVGEEDTVARLGGDEFAVLQANADPRAAEALARKLVEVISEPVEIDGQEINSGVSIGIALAPDDGTAADHLMKCADLALYRAKAEGRATFRFFEADMDARIQARRALEIDLRHALAAGEFSLVYQPQINLATNELIAMEALLRWTHAERGAVAPSEFIPLAEEMGLIVPLGEWVLREACKEAAHWPGEIRVAVNLSPVQFRNRGLVTMVTHALAAARLSAGRLELEITEAVLLQDDQAIVTMLHQLRALGVRISMDDFGTGYSSLSYLRSFPFDKIKIDRSFIKDIERNRDSASIIRAIASLGASLGIETTAEGIETTEQMELVRRAGCTEMQGYLVSRPVPAAELGDLIARYRREVAAA
jgi:diguanylate cyclase (GGDEF)-like protein/PAS domain S-box-containing protein